jgi:carboxynorspermidine decarboxylase
VNLRQIPSPSYVIEERRLRSNVALISSVRQQAGVEIILALKAFAMWKTFPMIREHIPHATASSVHEARLVCEAMKTLAHTYAPAYTEHDFPQLLKYSSHITFNSTAQYERFRPQLQAAPRRISCGLRINPEYATVATALYNPCAPGSRLGVTRRMLGATLPDGIEGLHFHTLCEASSHELEQTLRAVEEHFGDLFPRLRWLNMGGGHLMTRSDYDTAHLIRLLRAFQSRYPHLRLILEPGSAFTWQTGFLLTTVLDIVENGGIRTAIIDASFTCHMPDCLEMPYRPVIRGACEVTPGKPAYRIGGCSCLSGDWMGDWSFDAPLKPGDRLIFEDMIHYTAVKTTMFNGISHPALVLLTSSGQTEILRTYGYDDYRMRMD